MPDHPPPNRGRRPGTGAWVALGIATAGFAVLAQQAASRGFVTELDGDVAAPVLRAAAVGSAGHALAQGASAIGSPFGVLVIVAATAALAARWGERTGRVVGYLFTTGAVGTLADSLVKALIDRPRPSIPGIVVPSGSSFPSGHALGAVAGLGAAVVVLLPHLRVRSGPWRWLAAAVVALAIAVGLARVALGQHHPSDVVAGLALGAAWLIVSTTAFRMWPDGPAADGEPGPPGPPGEPG